MQEPKYNYNKIVKIAIEFIENMAILLNLFIFSVSLTLVNKVKAYKTILLFYN